MTSVDPAAARRATQAVPSIPCDAEGPVFREPWEAQAFAMTLSLYDRGLFVWPEWAAILGDEIKKAQAAGDPDTGETYYRHWLAALERIVAEKGVTDAGTLRKYYDAWDHAADRTPHGKPIELKPEDFGAALAARDHPGDRPWIGFTALGVRMCSGRTPRPRTRAGMRRSTGNHCSSRMTTAAASAARCSASAGDQQLVLHDHLHALGDPHRKFAPLLHRGEMRRRDAFRRAAARPGCWPRRPRPAPRD